MDGKFYTRISVAVLFGVLVGTFILFADRESEAQGVGPVVKWDRIEGNSQPGAVVAGVNSTGLPWTTTRGHAQLNVQTGKLVFSVKGLVLAGQAGPAVIGVPSPLVTEIKGTIVCDNVVRADSNAVPLSTQGDALFQGTVELRGPCNNIVFLIRNATENQLFNLWIAFGAVRSP